MAVDFTGRHIEITPALRRFTIDKLSKLGKYLGDIRETKVVLAVEKHRHIAEIIVHSRTATLSGSEETDDMYSAIGLVADKLERQAKKHKEKVKLHNKKKGTASIRTSLRPAAPSDEELPAPRRDERPRLIRTNRYRLRPMAAEEAALEVGAKSNDFLVFRNSASGRVAVVYRRPDGNIGIIEPEG